MNATTELTAGAPGAVVTTAPSRMAWWIAGGLGLVGAGALAAALVTQPAQVEDTKALPAKSAAAKTTTSKPVPRPVAAAPVNANYGTVSSVIEQSQKGEGTGLGAVGGAVVGGVLGHQVGGGNGKKVMTVVGAVGGGLAGHEIEKRARATTVYNVHLTMDDGSKRTVTQSTAPAVGARFEVEGNQLKSIPSKA
jgi:outer membrane lipoprotein SlyB